MSLIPSIHPKGEALQPGFLRSKSGIADHSDGDLETGVCEMHLCCSSSTEASQGRADRRAALTALQHGLETLTWVRAMSDVARYMQWPILDSHFSQRRNPQASEVRKSPVPCCNGNVLITLQLAFTEHSQRNGSWQGKCNPITIHSRELLAVAVPHLYQECRRGQPCPSSVPRVCCFLVVKKGLLHWFKSKGPG